MEISINQKDSFSEYVAFISNLYGDLEEKDLENKIAILQKAWDLITSNKWTFFVIWIKENNIPIGHAILFQDPEKKEVVQFGFFDYEKKAFQKIWNTIREISNKFISNKLVGPIDASIWHSYRVSDHNDDLYIAGEPLSKDYYSKCMDSLNPNKIISYYSAERTDIKGFIDRGISKHNIFILDKTTSIEKIEYIDKYLITAIHDISNRAFKYSWMFKKLDIRLFQELLKGKNISKPLIYLAKKNDSIIGFFYIDISNKDYWIAKTIAVDTKYQQQGFSAELLYSLHNDAFKNKIKKIIYALVRDSNNVKNTDVEGLRIINRYYSYEFVI